MRGSESSSDRRTEDRTDGDAGREAAEDRRPHGDLGEIATTDDVADAGSVDELVDSVVELAVSDPHDAGDRIGELIAVAREGDARHREAVDVALNYVGWHRPEEFEVWSTDLAVLAESGDADLALVGMRSLAQLASVNARAAAAGLDAAVEAATAPSAELRRAALAIIAEVGPDDPDRVGSADRVIAGRLDDSDPKVRATAAIAAGRLLAADPSGFPRTATALLDALDDGDDRVREYAHVALANYASEHPSAVPRKQRAMQALAAATDRELGLREGATGEALSALLNLELEFDLDIQG